MTMERLESLHQQIVREINSERNREMLELIAEKRTQRDAAADKEKRALDEMRGMGIEMDRFDAFHANLVGTQEREIAEIRSKYAADPAAPSRIDPQLYRSVALNATLVSGEAKSLEVPSYAAVFSTKDDQDSLAGGTGTDVYNYTVIDAWDWAKGAGSGLFGSGAGSYQVWAEWGYWFMPNANKYYSVNCHNVFRGYYIVKADDGFWTSKYARAYISVWVNVWQYNWKGWTNVGVLDVRDDNINVNNRFDTDRHTYYSALLGGGDWAYVRNVVGLYVYARGGGSYAELNFATGAANYLMAPHVHIF
jgi:hypothetical protein